jgi:CDP-paratose 2-epimerase
MSFPAFNPSTEKPYRNTGGGLRMVQMPTISRALVTGGAGFVGSNYASHLLESGSSVVVYDDFSRGNGCLQNLDWLKSQPSARNLSVVKAGVKDLEALSRAARDCDLIVHTAAQVSVPESISKPVLDFESNALGTFNVLEAARRLNTDPVLLYTSSNKVYGIPDVPLEEKETRYDFLGLPEGVDESFPVKGEEPYGVSKASGDLYLHAYAEQYSIRTVSFRCSCMFGPHQYGKEEQGWVAWFCIAAALGKPLSIFGDGKQVRDLLYIDDVARAFDLATDNIERVKGRAINLGGGKENVASLLETIAYLESLTNSKLRLTFKDWRPGDNKCYYTSCARASQLMGWKPTVAWKDGVSKTLRWVRSNVHQVSAVI